MKIIDLKIIEKIVCKYYKVPMSHLPIKTKQPNIARCRHIIYYLAKIFNDYYLSNKTMNYEKIAARYNQKRLDAYNGFRTIHDMVRYDENKLSFHTPTDFPYATKLAKELTCLYSLIKIECITLIPKLKKIREKKKLQQAKYKSVDPEKYKKHQENWKSRFKDRAAYLSYSREKNRESRAKRKENDQKWLNNCVQL